MVKDNNPLDLNNIEQAAEDNLIEASKNEKPKQPHIIVGKIDMNKNSGNIFDHIMEIVDDLINDSDNSENEDFEDEFETFIEESPLKELYTRDLEFSHTYSMKFDKYADIMEIDFDKIAYKSVNGISKEFNKHIGNLTPNAYDGHGLIIDKNTLLSHVDELNDYYKKRIAKCDKVLLFYNFHKSLNSIAIPVAFYNKIHKDTVMGLIYYSKFNTYKIYFPKYCAIGATSLMNKYEAFKRDTIENRAVDLTFIKRLLGVVPVWLLAFKHYKSKYNVKTLGEYLPNINFDNRENIKTDLAYYIYVGSFKFNDTDSAKDIMKKYTFNQTVDMYIKSTTNPSEILFSIIKTLDYNHVFNTARIEPFNSNAMAINIGI